MQTPRENFNPEFIAINNYLNLIVQCEQNYDLLGYYLDKIFDAFKNPSGIRRNAKQIKDEDCHLEIIDEQKIIHRFLEVLIPIKNLFPSDIINKNLALLEGIFDSPFFSFFYSWTDADNRNLPMRILASCHDFQDKKKHILIRNICSRWPLDLHTDKYLCTLGDYLASAFGSAFPEFPCNHPISKKLTLLHDDSRLPLAETEHLLAETIKEEMFPIEIYLVNQLFKYVQKDSLEILSENQKYLLLNNLFHNDFFTTRLGIFLKNSVVFCEFSRIGLIDEKMKNINNLKFDDINYLVNMKNQNIQNFEVFFCYVLLHIRSNQTLFKYARKIVNLDPVFSCNILGILLAVLNEQDSQIQLNTVSILKTLKKLDLTNYYPVLSRKSKDEIINSSVALFSAMQKKLPENSKERFNLQETVGYSALPIQGYIASCNRKKRHIKAYHSTSYNTELYPLNFDDKALIEKIDLALECLNFISTCVHFTNWNTIHQVLDMGALSRRCLIKYKIPFFQAALNPDLEKIDSDIVCLGFDDVDDLALKNCQSSNPPARIIINFKKLWQYRVWISGQVFIKEHDFFWTLKPGEEKNSANNYQNFVRTPIPHEFADPIAIGNLELFFYRTAFGIKFIINNQKHILLYSYFQRGDYAFKDEKNKDNYHVLEEVIDYDFGQTIFYGHPENTEKFFVMQFFRHIEKLPILNAMVRSALKPLCHNELVEVFNAIGKKLMHGSELNFQRGFYLPIECIEKVEFITHYDSSMLPYSYGCNSMFNRLKSAVIDFAKMARQVEKNQINAIKLAQNKFIYLFKSYRFLAFLLDKAHPGSETHQFLTSEFIRIYSKEKDISLSSYDHNKFNNSPQN